MFKHDSAKRDLREDFGAASPGSQRRLRRIEPAVMSDQLEFRCAHVASVLRAVQSAESPERAIEVVLETDEALVAFVNPLLFMCAISNLLHVAIKFSPDRSRVTIRSSATADAVCVQVEDQCGGLPAPTCGAHADERGFWLSTTRRMVTAMKGLLSVERTLGVGCTFRMLLPLPISPLRD